MRGSVKLETVGKYQRFRINYQGRRYTFNVSADTPKANAELLRLIQRDISKRILDVTLRRYKGFTPSASNQEDTSISKLFRQYTEATGIDLEASFHHYGTYMMLLKFGKTCTLENLPRIFGVQVMSASVFNKRKTHLKKFYDWLVRINWWNYNPINDLKSRKLRTTLPDNHKPFSTEEISAILGALKNNKFCQEKNQFKHSHYYLFVKFIFHTGVRVGEASALYWNNLDLKDQSARIERSYGSVTTKWSKKRVMREAKSESERTIQLTPEITRDLTALRDKSVAQGLVFPGPKGKPIDSRNFNKRVFYPILDGLNLPRRVIYAGRHSYVSLAIQQQSSLSDLQQQVGHKTINTTIKYYSLFKGTPRVNLNLPEDP